MGNLEILKYVLDELSLNDLDMLYTDLDIIGIIGIANAKMIAANTEVKEEKSEDSDSRIEEIYKEAFEMQSAMNKKNRIDEIEAATAAIKEQKEKAHPLEDRVIELEKTVEALKLAGCIALGDIKTMCEKITPFYDNSQELF